LKGFAVSSLQRSALAPDLPSLDEAGLKGYDLNAGSRTFAPAKNAEAVVDRLNAGFARRSRQRRFVESC